jgi:hypothetical protein
MKKIYWNLFGKIWTQNVGNIDLKMTSTIENLDKSQKGRFWKEKLVELNFYHSIQVKGIVMCLCCCWKDLDDLNLVEFMW